MDVRLCPIAGGRGGCLRTTLGPKPDALVKRLFPSVARGYLLTRHDGSCSQVPLSVMSVILQGTTHLVY